MMSDDTGLKTLFAATARLRLLTKAEEIELAKRRDRGEPNAVRKLVEHNIRLAVWRAKRWQGRGLPLDDLIQEGVFGLERAAQKFDPTRGIRYSTYATTWCDHFMQRAVGREDIVPYTVRRRRQKAEELKGKGLSVEEIADSLGCKVIDVVEALESAHVLTSLDVSEDGWHDKLAVPEPEDEITALRVQHAVALMTEDEREYVEARFGLGEGEPMSRQRAAALLGIKLADAAALEARCYEHLREQLADLEYDAGAVPWETLGPEPEVACARCGE